MTKQEWHKFYLNIAKMYGSLSKDPRLKVGALIVPNDFSKILGVGYNGFEKGGVNLPDSMEEGKSGAVHAEINCLIKVDNKLQYPNSYMYLTHSPCRVCARAIVNFGSISNVVYEIDYRDTSGLNILKERGICCEKIN